MIDCSSWPDCSCATPQVCRRRLVVCTALHCRLTETACAARHRAAVAEHAAEVGRHPYERDRTVGRLLVSPCATCADGAARNEKPAEAG